MSSYGNLHIFKKVSYNVTSYNDYFLDLQSVRVRERGGNKIKKEKGL